MIMKKYIALLSFVVALFAVSCSPYTDEEPGGVAVQDLCGTWTVTVTASLGEAGGTVDLGLKNKTELDAVDDWADVYDLGKLYLRTYNTADNVDNELWFDDAAFWQEKFKISCNNSKLTFEADSVEAVSGSGCKAVIRYGQVLKGAATTPRGVKADSIVAYVFYSDDTNGLTYKMSGYRYTGFKADK